MATILGTVTVNAAFLQEIKEDNRELRNLLAEARQAFVESHGTRPTARHVGDFLGELRDQLALHFSLEEAYGYFDEAVNVAPRLSDEAAALRDEHVELFRAICELAELAEGLLYGDVPNLTVAQIAREFGEFHERFQDHEARENELILKSFDDDIGVGD